MPDLDFYDLENYDLDGPTNGMVNYKSGSYTLTSASRNFIRDNGGISAYRYILISGLNFRPKKIAVRPRNGVTNVGVFYDFDSKKALHLQTQTVTTYLF
ncbi:hypothetical protein MT997_10150 [Paenibacillus sp. OVF10]|nr:hypothetical protein MT997_10150 [Paenibacillus sp. OVF10]